MKHLFGKLSLIVFVCTLCAFFGYYFVQYTHARSLILKISQEHEGVLAEQRTILADRETRIKEKDVYIGYLENENTELRTKLGEEQEKGALFEEQVSIIGKTIEEIQKLQNTDAELLKKYSKIYFLNENYKPEGLSTIPSEYTVNKKTPVEIHAKVHPFLIRLLQASEEMASSTPLRIISGFRSFEDQKSLKSNYTVTYGAGANKFSADQGYSEHQLGTTVDLSTAKLGTAFTQLATTPAYEWLKQNAHKYGFILSYPKGNTHYQYEPWHWRFVGVSLATSLYERSLNFYDVDQREIDSYLIKLFDEE